MNDVGGFDDTFGAPDPAPITTADPDQLHIVDPRDLAGVPVPPRNWIVKDWLPVGHVTLNYGDGGTGKTLLAQQLMTSCAVGADWIGLPVTRCKTFAMFCEDDEQEVHRRQDRINAAHGIDFGDLADMRWACAVGADNVLVRYQSDGSWHLTARFAELVTAATNFGAKLLVIDTAADTFGGNENDRGQVRAYLGPVLTKLARTIGAAIVLNAHPSRSGLSTTGDMDGGSTAWSNTARSRWALTRPADDDTGHDSRILSRRKANYSSIGAEVNLRWSNGVLVSTRQPASSGFDSLNRMSHAKGKFLDLLDETTQQNRPVSSSKNAGNTAYKLFAKMPNRDGLTERDFSIAMEALFSTNHITNVRYGRKGDEKRRIARSPEPASLDDLPADPLAEPPTTAETAAEPAAETGSGPPVKPRRIRVAKPWKPDGISPRNSDAAVCGGPK